MIIKDLNAVQNRDITKMSKGELAGYRSNLVETVNNANKISKRTHFKRINKFVSSIAGIGISIAAFKITLSLLYTGTIVLGSALPIGLCSLIPMIVTSILEKKAEAKYQNIRTVCNDKLIEVDRFIATQNYLESLKEANIQNVTKNSEHTAQNNGKNFDFFSQPANTQNSKNDEMQR